LSRRKFPEAHKVLGHDYLSRNDDKGMFNKPAHVIAGFIAVATSMAISPRDALLKLLMTDPSNSIAPGSAVLRALQEPLIQ
jgi:hypothetical protein